MRGGREVALGGPRQRALLAVLLTRANEVVPSDRLIDELWGEEPPSSAVNVLQTYVYRLRKAIGEDVLETRPPGYVVRVEPDQLDLHRFEALVEEASRSLAAGRAEEEAQTLREALALWRGPALADFGYEPFARAEVARLEELRLVALERRIEADLALGRHADLVGELEALVSRHPMRERLRGQLMLALSRAQGVARCAPCVRLAAPERAILVAARDETGPMRCSCWPSRSRGGQPASSSSRSRPPRPPSSRSRPASCTSDGRRCSAAARAPGPPPSSPRSRAPTRCGSRRSRTSISSSSTPPPASLRDASRLLATASLVIQTVAGIEAEPVLVRPGPGAVIAAAESAGLLVVDLSDRWQQEGVGGARLGLAGRASPPILFVRGGLRPGGLAPSETLTRFTWTLAEGTR